MESSWIMIFVCNIQKTAKLSSQMGSAKAWNWILAENFLVKYKTIFAYI